MVEATVLVRKFRRLQRAASCVEDVIVGALVGAFQDAIGFDVFVLGPE